MHTGLKSTCTAIVRGFQSLQNLVAVSQRYCQPLLTIKAGCMGSNGKNWLLNPESSSQSEGYSSKWLIWLVVREPLIDMDWSNHMNVHCMQIRNRQPIW